MSKMTELASGAITAVDTVTIELGEAVETPTIVIVTWPAKATVFHPAVSVLRGYCCPRLRRRRREGGARSGRMGWIGLVGPARFEPATP